jgi:hypothetical protein
MLNNLTFKHKKALLLAGCLLFLCIAYSFSFSKACEAFKINRQLLNQQLSTHQLDNAYPQLENEHRFYVNALRLYQVNNDDRENRLWQTVSSIAINKNVKISFTPAQSLTTDTSATQQLLKNQFNFKGSYVNCVLLLDSLSKNREIGLISHLKLLAQKQEHSEKELILQLTLSAIPK